MNEMTHAHPTLTPVVGSARASCVSPAAALQAVDRHSGEPCEEKVKRG